MNRILLMMKRRLLSLFTKKQNAVVSHPIVEDDLPIDHSKFFKQQRRSSGTGSNQANVHNNPVELPNVIIYDDTRFNSLSKQDPELMILPFPQSTMTSAYYPDITGDDYDASTKESTTVDSPHGYGYETHYQHDSISHLPENNTWSHSDSISHDTNDYNHHSYDTSNSFDSSFDSSPGGSDW